MIIIALEVLFDVIRFLTFKGTRIQRHLSKLMKAVIHATVRPMNAHGVLPVRNETFVASNGSRTSMELSKKQELVQIDSTAHARSETAKATRLMLEGSENPSRTNTVMLKLLLITATTLHSCEIDKRINDIIPNCLLFKNPVGEMYTEVSLL
ncbi:hypothetical protein PoB_001303200 [Plakobranchus ocellatus]|uniref:Uncharacterized protein n=1 Tax=Plakobranchus ocellatus TaxID=259542 RepID=A0AAV3YWH4_9GAST|nr:hypothetical protein PoB_001303200 [Plakobranchus ocellatus]